MKFILKLLLIFPILGFPQIEEDDYDRLMNLNLPKFITAVDDSIYKLESTDLWNFLNTLQKDYEYDLSKFNSSLLNKAEMTDGALDLNFLTKLLLKQGTDKVIIEKILNEKIDIWDQGNWSNRFWKLIREYKLNVIPGAYYQIDEFGNKTYDISKFLSEKFNNNELGENPLLFVDDDIIRYENGKLKEYMETIEIIQMEYTPKDRSVKLFGKRGIDGRLSILTK